MNRILHYAQLVAVCFCGSQVHGEEGAINPDSGLGPLKFRFEVALEVAAKSAKALEASYKNQLHELKAKHQDAGSLKDVLLIEEELENPGSVKPESSDLRRIQSIYLAERKRRRAAYREKEVSLYRKYGRAARELRDSLTRAGRIEDAKLADSEVKRVEEFIRTRQAAEKARAMIMGSIPKEAEEWRGHFYLMFDEKVTWDEAMARCKQLKGHIVTIADEEENEFVIKRAGREYCWIGATDEEKEGQWRWVTGEPFKFKGWWPGRPDNARPSEDYAVCRIQSNGGGWGDIHGSFKCRFMCEWEPEIPVAK